MRQSEAESILQRLEDWQTRAYTAMQDAAVGEAWNALEDVPQSKQESRDLKRLFHGYRPLIMDLVHKTLRSERPRFDAEELKGVAYLAFLRTLACYDAEKARVTTHLHVRLPYWVQAWITRNRKRRTSSRTRTVRKALQKLDNATLARKGRRPSFSESVEHVHQNTSIATRSAAQKNVRRVRQQEPDLSLDEPRGEGDEDTSLHELIPSESLREPHLERIGKRLAKRWGKEDIWESLQTDRP